MGTILIYALIVAVVGIGFLVVLYFILNALVTARLKSVHQLVASDVSVSSDWVEIAPEPAMRVQKQIQTVFLIIDGYEDTFDPFAETWEIKLSDGTIVEPEVQVLDGFGNVYELDDSTRVGNMIGFTPIKRNEGFGTYPGDRIYTKIRIRSDQPFRCSKVIWSNKNLK